MCVMASAKVCANKGYSIVDPLVVGVGKNACQLIPNMVRAILHALAYNFCEEYGPSEDSLPDVKRNCLELTGHIGKVLINVVNKDAEMDTSFISINELATHSLNEFAQECHGSDSFVKKHLVARLANLSIIVISVATRIIDIALGLIALPFACITCGQFESLNGQVVDGFASIGLIVSDIFLGTLSIFDPANNFQTAEPCGLEYETIKRFDFPPCLKGHDQSSYYDYKNVSYELFSSFNG